MVRQLDLTQLSDDECEHILRVVLQDFNIRQTEKQRLGYVIYVVLSSSHTSSFGVRHDVIRHLIAYVIFTSLLVRHYTSSVSVRHYVSQLGT